MAFEWADIIVSDTPRFGRQKRPVANCLVRVLSSDGRMTYSEQVTDTEGIARFLLPTDIDFQARMYKFGVSFKQPQLFRVLSPLPAGQSNVFDVQASVLTLPMPTDPRLCIAYGYFRDAAGNPLANVEFQFLPKFNPTNIDGVGVLREKVTVTTNDRGYTQVTLFRNGQYEATVPGEGSDLRDVHVPDSPNVNLMDMLFPTIDRVVLDPPGPYALLVGEELPLNLSIVTTDGRDIGFGFGDVRYRAVDPSILSYRFESNQLILQATGVGMSSITIERVDNTVVRIPDVGIWGQPFVATVVAP